METFTDAGTIAVELVSGFLQVAISGDAVPTSFVVCGGDEELRSEVGLAIRRELERVPGGQAIGIRTLDSLPSDDAVGEYRVDLEYFFPESKALSS